MQHLLRKQIILIGLFISISLSVIAQKDEVFQPGHDDLPYYLGMSIGMSNSYLNFKRGVRFLYPTASEVSFIQPGYTPYLNLGLTGTLKISKHFLARINPTLLISDKRAAFSFITNSSSFDTLQYTIPSTIIDLPIALKFQSDRYNALGFADVMRHYILAGAKVGFDLSSEKAATIKNNVPRPNVIKGTDFSVELGLGLSFYLRYATISPELKLSYGLRDLRKSDPMSDLLNSVDKVTSNFVYFTIHIEN